MPEATGGKTGIPAVCPLPAGRVRRRERPVLWGRGGDGAPRPWAHGPSPLRGLAPRAQEHAASVGAPANAIVFVNETTWETLQCACW